LSSIKGGVNSSSSDFDKIGKMPPLPSIEAALPDFSGRYNHTGIKDSELQFANEFYRMRDKKMSLLET